MQLKGACAIKRGPVSVTGPSVPGTGAPPLFNSLIVGHSPDFNCMGPRGSL